MKKFILLLSVFGLSACIQGNYQPTSGYWDTKTAIGETISLNAAVPISGFATDRMQNGQLRPYSRTSQYYTSCRITTDGSVSKIEADQFIIENATFENTLSALDADGAHYASLEQFSQTHGITAVFKVVFDLVSTTQPQVKQLICTHWADYVRYNNVSPTDINLALTGFGVFNHYPAK